MSAELTNHALRNRVDDERVVQLSESTLTVTLLTALMTGIIAIVVWDKGLTRSPRRLDHRSRRGTAADGMAQLCVLASARSTRQSVALGRSLFGAGIPFGSDLGSSNLSACTRR